MMIQNDIFNYVLDNIDAGVIVSDKEGNVIYRNNKARQFFGENTLLTDWGNTFGIYLSDKTTVCPVEKLPLSKALNGEKSQEEFYINNCVNKDVWIKSWGIPIVDGGLFIFNDITDNKELQNDYWNLYEKSPIGVWRTKLSDGTFLRLNKVCAKTLGYKSPKELIGKKSTIFYPEETRKLFLDQLTRNGFVKDYEVYLKLHNDESIWISLNAYISQDEQFLEGFLINITEKKELQQALGELHDIEYACKSRLKELDSELIHAE